MGSASDLVRCPPQTARNSLQFLQTRTAHCLCMEGTCVLTVGLSSQAQGNAWSTVVSTGGVGVRSRSCCLSQTTSWHSHTRPHRANSTQARKYLTCISNACELIFQTLTWELQHSARTMAASGVTRATVVGVTDATSLTALLDAGSDEAILNCLQGKQGSSFWNTAAGILEGIVGGDVEAYLGAIAAYEHGHADSAEIESTFHLMSRLASLAHSALADKQAKVCPGLMRVVCSLHDQVFYVKGPAGDALRSGILKLCIRYWCQGRPQAEAITVQMVPALLVHATQPDAKDADIKRLLSVKDAFHVFDLEHESADGVKELILRAFAAPLFLRTKENARFLEFALGLHAELVPDIHATVLSVLPESSKGSLRSLANVYFKGWAKAEGAARLAVEQAAIQDLMHKGVTAAVPSTFAAVRRMLSGLAEHKRAAGVDAMLTRCWAPILWRALDAPNAAVRRNAATLWLDTFPLGDADGPTSAYEAILQQQFDALAGLLTDPAGDVRVVGVQGTARVLSLYWELIPAAAIKGLLSTLVGQCSRDAACSAVREAVGDGMAFLLEQPLAHATLAQVLPLLGHLLHDRSVKVRAAMARLLLALQALKGITFMDVVPVPDALARLALDAEEASVAGPLTALLLPSFMPPAASGSEWATRTLKALHAHPAATLAFFRNAPAHASAGSVGKVLLILHKAVNKAIKAAEAAPTKRKRSRDAAADGAESDEEGVADVVAEGGGAAPSLDATNTALMSACLRAAATLWGAMEPPKDSLATKLQAAFSADTLCRWLQWFSSAARAPAAGAPQEAATFEITGAIAALASMLPAAERAPVTSWLVQHVMHMPSHGAGCPPALPALVDALCDADAEGELLLCALLTAHSALADGESGDMHPMTALWVLRRVLQGSHSAARHQLLELRLANDESVLSLGTAATMVLSLAGATGEGLPPAQALQAALAFSVAASAAAHTAAPSAAGSAWSLPQQWGEWSAWLITDALPAISLGTGAAGAGAGASAVAAASLAKAASDMALTLASTAADIAAAGGASEGLVHDLTSWAATPSAVSAWLSAPSVSWDELVQAAAGEDAALTSQPCADAVSHLLRLAHRLCTAAVTSTAVSSTSAAAVSACLVRVLLAAAAAQHPAARMSRSSAAAALGAAASLAGQSAFSSVLPSLAQAAGAAGVQAEEGLPPAVSAGTTLFHAPADSDSGTRPLRATAPYVVQYCSALGAFLAASVPVALADGAEEAALLPVAGTLRLMAAASAEAPPAAVSAMRTAAGDALTRLSAAEHVPQLATYAAGLCKAGSQPAEPLAAGLSEVVA